VSRKVHLLNPNHVSELIMDSDNDKSQCTIGAVEHKECCEEVLLEANIRTQSVCTVCFSAQAPLSPDAVITFEEENDVQSEPIHQTQWAPDLQWTLPSCLQNSVIQTFTGGHRGKNGSETPCTSDNSTPFSAFMLYFVGLSHCMWWRLGRYYLWRMDSLDDEPSPQPDLTEAGIFLFLAIKIQI
jgi:hypothetical protein